MIHQAKTDPLDDAIDEFEATWSSNSRDQMESLLSRYGLIEDEEAIAELIRIDIELRYENDISLDLSDYFDHFEHVLRSPNRVAEIAFEDYRSRTANGHAAPVSRWSELPGVREQPWFRQLALGTYRDIGPQVEAVVGDELFELSLRDEGFRLVEEIGAGNFSRVYLAIQRNLNDRFVVLKVVNEALAEPDRMAMLQHTNIVPIYSVHEIESRSVICMPYAGRVTLADYLKATKDPSLRAGESLAMTVRASQCDTRERDEGVGPLGIEPLMAPAAHEHAGAGMLDAFSSFSKDELATWIFQRLAGALAHSHARGVLHNDLKPSNVLIRNDGEPALMDFNLSQSLTGETPNRIGGTLPYMSPETLRAMMGMEFAPKPTSDLYGLGVMLFEFVTGRLPYPKPASIAAIDLQVAINQRKSPAAWKREDAVSPGLKAIIERCLRTEPGQRYASADDLQSDLNRERENYSLRHTPEPAQWRFRKWVRRHPRTVAGSLVAGLLLSILVPLGISAAATHRENEILASERDYVAFAKESTDVLSALMVDPKRVEKDRILRGMKTLEKHGVLTDEGRRHLMSHRNSDERGPVEEGMLRHITQVAFLEVTRLSRHAARNESDDISFERLDQLIEGAEQFGERGLRARSFLQAERARLQGQTEEYLKLKRAAESTPSQNDSEDYLEAVRLIGNQKFNDASKILASLADRNTIPSALRWTMLGRAQHNAKRYDDALLSFSQSIQRASDSAPLYVLRGLTHGKLGNGVQARRDYAKATELDRTNVRAWNNLGLACEASGEHEKAIQAYTRLLELSPQNVHALLGRSRVHRKLGREQLADADFEAAFASKNIDANSLVNRSMARGDVDPEGALQDLKQAVHLEPERMSLRMHLARLLALKLQRYDDSIAIYDEVLEVQPQNEIALVDQAVLLAYQKRFDAALKNLSVALVPPNQPRNLYQAACVNALMPREPRHRRALSLLAEAIAGGYTRDTSLASDPDLESLLGYEDFQSISRTHDLFRRSRRRGQSTQRGAAAGSQTPEEETE